jgi:gliding motility-associated-like protein
VDFNGRLFDTIVTVHEAIPVNITKSTVDPSCEEYDLDGSISNDGSISYSASGGAGSFTYAWADTSLTSPSRQGLTAGSYTATITDANGCEIVNTTILSGEEAINARLYTQAIAYNGTVGPWWPVEDTLVCYRSRYNLSVDYDMGDIFEWVPDIYFDEIDEDYATITAREEGQIVVYVSTDQCMDFEVLNITLYDTLNAYVITNAVTSGDTVFAPQGNPLILWNEQPYIAYNWTGTGPFTPPEDTTDASVTLVPEEDQIITFEGTTSDGCVETDYVYIIIQRPIDVYDVFTPNDDGYNDYWVIPNANQYLNLEVFIFDRWGQQVFHSKPYGTDMHHVFDGKSQKNGKDLPVGTYYYIIKPNDGEQRTFTGTVTIVR